MVKLSKAVVAHSKTMSLRNAMIAELVALGFKEDQEWNDMYRSNKDFQYIYIAEDGTVAIHNHDCSATTKLLHSLPSQWDAFLAEVERLTVVAKPEYNVGDWVTVINTRASSLNQVGETYQILSKKTGIVKSNLVDEVIYNLGKADHGYWECNDSIRPATKGEIATAKERVDIRLGGYQMKSDKRNQTISFGCQTFSKEQVEGLLLLVYGPAKAKITIVEEQVTWEMLAYMLKTLG